MSETVQYGLIGKQDIKRGFGTFQVKLADGQVVTLDELDIAYLTSDAFTEANLPTTGTGRLARVTDGAKGLWMLGPNGTWYALNGECVNVNDFATLAAAISDISTTTRTLIISDSVTVSANLTIPANVTCLFTNQGQISVSAAVTLTFSGLIRAPRRQIFAGSGTVDFGDGSTGTVYPEWFGAVVDGSTDDTSKVQTAVDACSTGFGGVVEISPNTTWTPGSVTIPAGVLVMDYSDPDAPVWRTSTGTRTMMENLDGAGAIFNATLSITMSSNAVTVALKTKAGSDPSAADPVKIAFRHATITNGTYTVRSVTSALSTTISSGSTLGTTSNVLSRIYVGAIDNSGTVELCVWNGLSYAPLEKDLASTTAEGGAGGADSAVTLYSSTARSNVPLRVLGYFESTQVTAGTWAASASKVHLLGQTGLQYVYPSLIGVSAATTSGTTKDFTGLPSWVRRLTIGIKDFSTNGTSAIGIQLGTGGSPTTSGYSGNCTESNSSPSWGGTAWNTMALLTRSSAAASALTTMVHCALIDSATNTWMIHSVSRYAAGDTQIFVAQGTIALSGTLDNVRLTTASGDTFDAGSVNILYVG